MIDRGAKDRPYMLLDLRTRRLLETIRPPHMMVREGESMAEAIWWHYMMEWYRHASAKRPVTDTRLQRFIQLHKDLQVLNGLTQQQRGVIELLLFPDRGTERVGEE